MRLTDRFRRRPDPTRDWSRRPGLELSVDLDWAAFCDVRLGQPVSYLSEVGPSEDSKAAAAGEFRYPSEGFCLHADEAGNFGSFLLVFAGEPGFAPFTGQMTWQAKTVGPSPRTTEADIYEWFGDAYWRAADADEVILFYERPASEWQIELSVDGKLRAWLVAADPIMASADQRRAYGVTAPWPPPF